MEENSNKKASRKTIISISAIIVLALAIGLVTIYYFGRAKSQPAKSTEETYSVVANETDGPEQIFEKAFKKYGNKHNLSISDDELRQVAEYMAANNLKGKAYWTDANGQRHELWIGTGDIIILGKNYSTFSISNAITDNQRKTVNINFGFKDAQKQLDVIKAQAPGSSN